jgi:transposase InsO family protein
VKYAFIEAEKARWRVRPMCRALGVSTAGYYAWRRRPESERSKQDRQLGVLVSESHARSRTTYGSPRVHADLKAQGVKVSRKRVARLMAQHGLRGRVRRAHVRTTDSPAGAPPAKNLLDRDFTATRPNQRWVGDVTYLRTPEGWLYLAVILDLYSRMVVGWATSPVNDRMLALRALSMAIVHRKPDVGLLHHTDQGSPYASDDYQDALSRAGITCSMSRRGNCYDNAVMESWFGLLKAELGESFDSQEAAGRELFDYIEVFYNGVRRHGSLGFLSPRDYEAQPFA